MRRSVAASLGLDVMPSRREDAQSTAPSGKGPTARGSSRNAAARTVSPGLANAMTELVVPKSMPIEQRPRISLFHESGKISR